MLSLFESIAQPPHTQAIQTPSDYFGTPLTLIIFFSLISSILFLDPASNKKLIIILLFARTTFKIYTWTMDLELDPRHVGPDNYDIQEIGLTLGRFILYRPCTM